MTLQLDSFKRALISLNASLQSTQKVLLSNDTSIFDDTIRETLRAGVIQNFEVAYELCWKFIQRWLVAYQNINPSQIRTRKELFRIAAKQGLIQDPISWFEYGDARNLTSHTYEESSAKTVYEVCDDFLKDAQYLLSKLEEHND